MTKPLAKSLHTITVIKQVARMWRNTDTGRGAGGPIRDWSDYVYSALVTLDLHDKPDNYGLADAAIAQLKKGK